MAKRELLLGDEALALGALHAGLSGVYAYPGTPSTEITEYIQGHPLTAQRGIHCTWSANEKTAMEEALGMSFAGKRALVCMKHVGMNVAADAFVNSAMTGANGGLVVVAADDPSMHSSQNEQDSRFYGKFALVPTFEPSTQQEAYEMVQAAFDFSEKYRIPVLMRLTTRMAHSRAMVEPREARPENSLAYPARTRQWVLMPGNSRVRYEALLADYARFEEEAAASPFNRYADAEDKSLGIIACGIAHKPELIFFDEPTVAVDPQSRNAILSGIQGLRDEGATVVYTSHYMEEVEQICSQIMIMDRGRVLAQGTNEELKRMVSTGEKIVVELSEPPARVLERLRALPHVIDAAFADGELTVRCGASPHNLVDVLGVLGAARIVPGRVWAEPPTLNDVFLELTGRELRD